MRDMLPLRRETAFNSGEMSKTWSERWADHDLFPAGSPEAPQGEPRSWKLPGLMLAAADHLWVRRVGFAPLAPTGVALGASIREVSHVGPGLSTSDLPIRTFDTYVSS